MLHSRWLAAGALLLLGAAAPAQTPPAAQPGHPGGEIQTRTLKNGLKVIVWPDHDIPNVALYNWFHVGSRNEAPGITGLSHFFEHMMFNGAKKYGPGEFDRVLEAAGGSNNAFTSENVTVYQDWFPRAALTTVFDLEADRIGHLAIDPKIVESERGVVYSERRSSVDNDNTGLLLEQVQATAFVAHPYQFPVVGWPSDIERWTQKDLERYFRTYYAPNNATLILSGDVTPAEVFALAEKYLGPIPRQPAPEPVRTVEPPQLGERRLVVHKAAQSPLLQMAFHSLSGKDPEVEALEVLVSILTDGDSSRLHRALVEEARVAIQVRGMYDPGFDPSLTLLLVDLPPGGDLAKTEALLSAQLARVAKEGVTDAELRKAKNIAVADFWRSLETINGRAQALGRAEVFQGDYRKLFDTPKRFEAVTREQVRKLAARVFDPNNRTVGTLVPTDDTATQQEAAR